MEERTLKTKRKDKNGNQIYWEYENGDWYYQKFNENNIPYYAETSTGCWSKTTFDKNGKEKTYEESDGSVRIYLMKNINTGIIGQMSFNRYDKILNN